MADRHLRWLISKLAEESSYQQLLLADSKANPLETCDKLQSIGNEIHGAGGVAWLRLRYMADGEACTFREWLCRKRAAFILDRGLPEIKVDTMPVADFAKAMADGKTDGKKNSWPKTPENPDVAKLAKKIRDNTGAQRNKTDIAREFTDNNEKRAQSLLRKLRPFPHLLNAAE